MIQRERTRYVGAKPARPRVDIDGRHRLALDERQQFKR